MKGVVLVGRILFSLIFILSGLNHLMQLNNYAAYASSKGVPAAKLLVAISGILLLLGGLGVLLGFKTKLAAWLLVIFLLPTAFIMHNFWVESDAMMRANQMAHFLKNLSMAGAALLIAYFGAGPASLDAKAGGEEA